MPRTITQDDIGEAVIRYLNEAIGLCPKCKNWETAYSPEKIKTYADPENDGRGAYFRVTCECDKGHRWTRWNHLHVVIIAKGELKGDEQIIAKGSNKPKPLIEI